MAESPTKRARTEEPAPEQTCYRVRLSYKATDDILRAVYGSLDNSGLTQHERQLVDLAQALDIKKVKALVEAQIQRRRDEIAAKDAKAAAEKEAARVAVEQVVKDIYPDVLDVHLYESKFSYSDLRGNCTWRHEFSVAILMALPGVEQTMHHMSLVATVSGFVKKDAEIKFYDATGEATSDLILHGVASDPEVERLLLRRMCVALGVPDKVAVHLVPEKINVHPPCTRCGSCIKRQQQQQ